MARIYAFQLATGSYKVGHTKHDNPYDRAEKTFSPGLELYRSFAVDPFHARAIEGIIHAQLGLFRDWNADGKEIFNAQCLDELNASFDFWEQPENQMILLSESEKTLLECFKRLEPNQLTPAIAPTSEILQYLENWSFHKVLADKHQKQADLWYNRIAVFIGDAWGIAGELEWKPSKRSGIDLEKLRAKYPEVAADCAVETWQRSLRRLLGYEKK